MSTRESKRGTLKVGQHVRHFCSGWAGHISVISDEEACGQGRLVTVELTHPKSPGPRPWRPITVTEDELEPTP